MGCLSQSWALRATTMGTRHPRVGSKSQTTVPESCRAEQAQGCGNSPRVTAGMWEPWVGTPGQWERRGLSPRHGAAGVSRLPCPLPLQVQRPLSEQTRALCKGSSGTCARSCLHPRQTLHRNTCGSPVIPGLSLLSTPGRRGHPRHGCGQHGGHRGRAGVPRGAGLRAKQEGWESIGRGLRWILARTLWHPKGPSLGRVTLPCPQRVPGQDCSASLPRHRGVGGRAGAVPRLCRRAEGTGTYGRQHRGRAPGIALGIATGTGTAAPGGAHTDRARGVPATLGAVPAGLPPAHTGAAAASPRLPSGVGAARAPTGRGSAARRARGCPVRPGPARLGSERSRISGWAGAEPPPSGVPSSFPAPGPLYNPGNE